tara:strand:- start:62 stop:547 length:486 start_codon:yes stop_codon:yes gene_type:complete
MKIWIKIFICILVYTSSLLNGQIALNINAIPRQVEVFLDGESIGKTPIMGYQISPGPHDFELTKKGYAPVTYSLIVNPSRTINLDFYLNPIYKIKFTTEEQGLTFELNKNHQWRNKKIRIELEAGEHLLRVYKKDKVVDEQTILVDEPKHFKYFLKKKLSN